MRVIRRASGRAGERDRHSFSTKHEGSIRDSPPIPPFPPFSSPFFFFLYGGPLDTLVGELYLGSVNSENGMRYFDRSV